MKYRKKPVVIEANQLGNGPTSDTKLAEWCGGTLILKTSDDHKALIPTIAIETLEGVMTATPGDWIIKGVAGEFYPCKDEIFQKSYEPAE